MISNETINQIKSRIDIVDVISDFVTLKKSGMNYKALSPFTNEKTASFYVVPEKGIFKDFSSGKGGDAITFVMEHESLGYAEALKLLAKKYGITIEENVRDFQSDQASEAEALSLVLKFAAKYFEGQLMSGAEGSSVGMQYLEERQINLRSVAKFQIGYAANEWHALEEEALRKGFSSDVLEKSGLVVKNEAGKVYDRFRGRVIFPITSLAGKVIGFGGRTMGKDLPKYINSPESVVYKKSQVLYGIFESKAAIRRNGFAYLVEGYTDVISMHQSGFENVVASAGTALTRDQVKLLKRFTDNVTILFDGDAAGIKASEKGIDIIIAEGMDVKVVMLPEGEDPDSFCRKTSASKVEAFLKEHTKDFISHRIDFAAAGKEDTSRKSAAIREVLISISVIPDALKRMIYLQDLSKRTGVEIAMLTIEIKKLLLQRDRVNSNIIHEGDTVYDTRTGSSMLLSEIHTLSKGFVDSLTESLKRFEREFVKVLLNHGHRKLSDGSYTFEYLFEEAQDVDFVEPIHQEVMDMVRVEVAKSSQENSAKALKGIVGAMPKHMSVYCSQLLVQKHFVSDGWKQNHIDVGEEYDPESAALKVILQLKLAILSKMQQDNLQKCKILTAPEDQEEIMEIHAELDKYKNEIASRLGRTIININSAS